MNILLIQKRWIFIQNDEFFIKNGGFWSLEPRHRAADRFFWRLAGSTRPSSYTTIWVSLFFDLAVVFCAELGLFYFTQEEHPNAFRQMRMPFVFWILDWKCRDDVEIALENGQCDLTTRPRIHSKQDKNTLIFNKDGPEFIRNRTKTPWFSIKMAQNSFETGQTPWFSIKMV